MLRWSMQIAPSITFPFLSSFAVRLPSTILSVCVAVVVAIVFNFFELKHLFYMLSTCEAAIGKYGTEV